MRDHVLIRQIVEPGSALQFRDVSRDSSAVIFFLKVSREKDRRLRCGFQLASWNQGRLRIPRILANNPDSSPAD